MKKLSLVIALLSVTVGAWTQSSISNVYSRLGIGLLEQPGNVNSLGMGGISTVSFDNNALNLFNPASYSHLSRTVLQLTGKGIQSSLNNGESTTRYRGGQIQEIGLGLKQADIGISTAIGIGGDPIIGIDQIKSLELFQNDPETEMIILVGEIGGSAEEEAAEYIKSNVRKPVIGYVAGVTAPPGKRMGHAGAIIAGNKGTAKSKREAFEAANVKVADTPYEIIDLVKQELAILA